MLHGKVEEFLSSRSAADLEGKIQLIFTSPPFPLNRKKNYGNLQGNEFVVWLSRVAVGLQRLLTRDGSIAVEMGNAWEPGEPVMSTLALEALLAFREAGGYKLCQQFICHNPARLPSPAQWVNVERIRVKDSYTHVWWMSNVARPKANNKKVLKSYSTSMLKLLETKKYNSGNRPSEHHIGKTSFLTRHEGAIPSNVLTFTNTSAQDKYLAYCRKRDLPIHPARMPTGLADFFIRFLTDEKDCVLDPFGGSNTTGFAAERLRRRWISIEPSLDYIEGSRGRFSV